MRAWRSSAVATGDSVVTQVVRSHQVEAVVVDGVKGR